MSSFTRYLPLCILFLLPCGPALLAQGFSGGFRAGLNFMTIDGDREGNGNMTFERFNRTTGFHVGATFAYGFTDLVGVKANFMYTQKGYERVYDGPGFLFLYQNANDMAGTAQTASRVVSEIDVVNSYIEIPVVGYYKIGPVEIEGGLYAGFLVNSRASGALRYNLPVLGPDEELVVNVEANYFTDEAGFASRLAVAETPLPGSSGQVFPPSIIGAYYNNTDDGRLYQSLDFGAIGGVAVALNNGLFLGLRYQLGLSDITRGENDLAAQLENGQRQFNTEDEDRYRVIQASIGFRF